MRAQGAAAARCLAVPPGPAGSSAATSQLLDGLSVQAMCVRGARLWIGAGLCRDGREAGDSGAICNSVGRAAARSRVAPMLGGVAALHCV